MNNIFDPVEDPQLRVETRQYGISVRREDVKIATMRSASD
jgi:hypothetical protein